MFCNKIYILSFTSSGRAYLGPGSPEHLLHSLHPVPPRQEVQQDRDVDHGEAEE